MTPSNERNTLQTTYSTRGEEVLNFGSFRMFPARKLLLDGDEPVLLGGRAFDLLKELVRNAGDVINKEELMTRVWPAVIVQEGSLRVQIAGLRKALRDGEGGRRLIVNNAGRGYSFVAPVSSEFHSNGEPTGQISGATGVGLPTVLTTIYGRDAFIDLLATELPEHRFITIVGPGGIGKTTVALAASASVCRSYRDGACFVDFSSINDPDLVPSAVTSAMGLPVKSHDPIPDLIAFLRDKQLLLLMDNCEHVIDAAAHIAEAVLSHAPHVQILATSREPLGARGERVHPLGPLDVPLDNSYLTVEDAMRFSAVQVFVDRTNAALGKFEIRDADVPIIVEICRRLDGMALAIELATARVGSLGLPGVAAQLDDRFRLLSRGLRTAPPRHRTLNAVFEWSYLLLPPATQRVFRGLSIMAGNFTLEAGHAVTSDGRDPVAEIADSIAILVAASLIIANVSGESVVYRLLDSARAYGRDRLIEEAELEVTSRRHAMYFLEFFRRAGVRSHDWSSVQWVEAYKSQLDNLRAALDWASSRNEGRLRDALTAAAVPLWTHLSLNEECRNRVESALTHRLQGATSNDQYKVPLLAALGMSLLYTRGGGPDANRAWRDCLAAAERIGDINYQLRAIAGMWSASFNEGDVHTAQRLRDRFDAVVGLSPSAEDSLHSQRMRGIEKFYHGRFDEARRELQNVYDGYSQANYGMDVLRYRTDQTVLACVNLSKMLWLQGFADKAKIVAAESLDRARAVNHDISVTYALALGACRISIITGDFAVAESHILQLAKRGDIDRTGPWKYYAQCWEGTSLSRQGNAGKAVELLSDALRGIPEGSFGMHQTRFLGELAYAVARAGDVQEGLTKIQKAIEICDRLDERWFYAELLRLQGEILLLDGGLGAVIAAKEKFVRAINLARNQGGLSYELRAAHGLARLTSAHGGESGVGRLAEVYGRFTEGFGTADLVEARSFLDSHS